MSLLITVPESAHVSSWAPQCAEPQRKIPGLTAAVIAGAFFAAPFTPPVPLFLPQPEIRQRARRALALILSAEVGPVLPPVALDWLPGYPVRIWRTPDHVALRGGSVAPIKVARLGSILRSDAPLWTINATVAPLASIETSSMPPARIIATIEGGNMASYEVGDTARLKGKFLDQSGHVMDPDTAAIRVKQPDGTVTIKTYGTDSELVKEGTGIYHLDVDLGLAGVWHYTWFSTGTGKASESGQLTVAADAVPADAVPA